MRPDRTRLVAGAVGCAVREVDEEGGPRVRLACASPWATARLLLELAKEDVREPLIQKFAARIGSLRGDFAANVHTFITRSIRFEREDGEIFQAPMVTIARAAGDCDCHARLAYALLRAGGVAARLAFLHRGRGPLHVLAQAWDVPARAWRWLETTVPGARYSEHPIVAARRTGVLRSDVSGQMEVVYMGEQVIVTGSVYAMRVGFLPNEAAEKRPKDKRVAEALARAGFEFGRLIEAVPLGAPPSARDPVANAKETMWLRAVAKMPGIPHPGYTHAPGVRNVEFPIFGDGLVLDEPWQVG